MSPALRTTSLKSGQLKNSPRQCSKVGLIAVHCGRFACSHVNIKAILEAFAAGLEIDNVLQSLDQVCCKTVAATAKTYPETYQTRQ